VIFAAIAVAWLAYLVPLFVRRRGDEIEEPATPQPFADSLRVVRYGTAPLLDQDLERIGSVEVSTPMTRRAALEDLRRLDRLAARRRRRVMVALMFALTACISLAAFDLIPWWSVASPTVLLVVFVVVARVSVRVMRRQLDERYQAIRRGSSEATVFLSREEVVRAGELHTRTQLPLSDPPAKPGRLWDSVPITMPTYVSKPLAPRTVRTIDLSAPEPTAARMATPVTADAPERQHGGRPAGEETADVAEAASA
jgi:hypothetical protein